MYNFRYRDHFLSPITLILSHGAASRKLYLYTSFLPLHEMAVSLDVIPLTGNGELRQRIMIFYLAGFPLASVIQMRTSTTDAHHHTLHFLHLPLLQCQMFGI